MYRNKKRRSLPPIDNTSKSKKEQIDKKKTQNENVCQGNILTRMRSAVICLHKSTNTDMKPKYKYRYKIEIQITNTDAKCKQARHGMNCETNTNTWKTQIP